MHLKGFLLLCCGLGLGTVSKGGIKVPPQGPRLAPEDVYFVSWSLRRPL